MRHWVGGKASTEYKRYKGHARGFGEKAVIFTHPAVALYALLVGRDAALALEVDVFPDEREPELLRESPAFDPGGGGGGGRGF